VVEAAPGDRMASLSVNRDGADTHLTGLRTFGAPDTGSGDEWPINRSGRYTGPTRATNSATPAQ